MYYRTWEFNWINHEKLTLLGSVSGNVADEDLGLTFHFKIINKMEKKRHSYVVWHKSKELRAIAEWSPDPETDWNTEANFHRESHVQIPGFLSVVLWYFTGLGRVLVQKKTILRLSPYEKVKAEIVFSSSWNSNVLFSSCKGELEITLIPRWK